MDSLVELGNITGQAWEEVLTSVDFVANSEQLPFSSLASRLQRKYKCRILIESEAPEDNEPLGRPAVCFSKWWELENEGVTMYLPNHLILVDKNHINTFAGRFGIAHELGHICLHLSQLDSKSKIKLFEETRLSPGYRARYERDHELDAFLFATVLCIARPGKRVRAPSNFAAFEREIERHKESLPQVDQALEAINLVRLRLDDLDGYVSPQEVLTKVLKSRIPDQDLLRITSTFDTLEQNVKNTVGNVLLSHKEDCRCVLQSLGLEGAPEEGIVDKSSDRICQKVEEGYKVAFGEQ